MLHIRETRFDGSAFEDVADTGAKDFLVARKLLYTSDNFRKCHR